MTFEPVSVIIPVGPEAAQQRWLGEAIASAKAQTHPAIEVLLVDDMAGLPYQPGVTTWHAPWRLGVAAAFNCGVGLVRTRFAFMLGADDTLAPNCIAQCLAAWAAAGSPEDAYIWTGVRYSDGRLDQYAPCNAAMVTRALWKKTGGFPVETASGAPDAAFVSIMIAHPELAPALICANQAQPLYNYRVHEDTDTAGRQPWQGVILGTRDLVTQLWKPPTWTGLLPPDERPCSKRPVFVEEAI